MEPQSQSRIGTARQRVTELKLVTAGCSLAVFAVLVPAVEAHHHAKASVSKTLSAPKQFVQAVRQNLLQAGEVAPASGEQPPVVSGGS